MVWIFLKKWEVQQSAIFIHIGWDCQVSCFYLSFCWSYPKLPQLLAWWYFYDATFFFQFLYPSFCTYFFYRILWLACYYLLALPYQLESVFSFIVLNNCILSIVLYFSISLDRIVSKNSSCFGNRFWWVIWHFQNRIFHSIWIHFLDEADCISHSTNTPGKCMSPIILLL